MGTPKKLPLILGNHHFCGFGAYGVGEQVGGSILDKPGLGKNGVGS